MAQTRPMRTARKLLSRQGRPRLAAGRRALPWRAAVIVPLVLLGIVGQPVTLALASSSIRLPSNFPRSVPQPARSVLEAAASVKAPGGGYDFDLTYSVQGTVVAVSKGYEAQLQKAKFTITVALKG